MNTKALDLSHSSPPYTVKSIGTAYELNGLRGWTKDALQQALSDLSDLPRPNINGQAGVDHFNSINFLAGELERRRREASKQASLRGFSL